MRGPCQHTWLHSIACGVRGYDVLRSAGDESQGKVAKQRMKLCAHSVSAHMAATVGMRGVSGDLVFSEVEVMEAGKSGGKAACKEVRAARVGAHGCNPMHAGRE